MIGIYKIISPTGKIYIGQSVDIEKRWRDHIKGYDKGGKLQNSIRKHGFENHKFEIKEECSIELLNERERYWQDFYNVLGPNGLNLILTTTETKSGYMSEEQRKQNSRSQKIYNKTMSTEKREQLNKKQSEIYHNKSEEEKQFLRKRNSELNKGRVVSKETRLKLSLSRTGRTLSEETKKKISLSKKNKEVSIETRTKLSKVNRDKVFSEEHKTKISLALKNKPKSEETKLKISNALKSRHKLNKSQDEGS